MEVNKEFLEITYKEFVLYPKLYMIDSLKPEIYDFQGLEKIKYSLPKVNQELYIYATQHFGKLVIVVQLYHYVIYMVKL